MRVINFLGGVTCSKIVTPTLHVNTEIKFCLEGKENGALALFWLLLVHTFCQERFQKRFRSVSIQRYIAVGRNKG